MDTAKVAAWTYNGWPDRIPDSTCPDAPKDMGKDKSFTDLLPAACPRLGLTVMGGLSK